MKACLFHERLGPQRETSLASMAQAAGAGPPYSMRSSAGDWHTAL